MKSNCSLDGFYGQTAITHQGTWTITTFIVSMVSLYNLNSLHLLYFSI